MRVVRGMKFGEGCCDPGKVELPGMRFDEGEFWFWDIGLGSGYLVS
jgi:hypothetical protein